MTNPTPEMLRRTERGWAGHFIDAGRCRFRRNTLLELKDAAVVVSTVGLMYMSDSGDFEEIGLNRHFETRAFHAERGTRYQDADVEREVSFESPWAIADLDADDKANDMHEAAVDEISAMMREGRLRG